MPTLEIRLSDQDLKRLDERARLAGRDLADYARQLIRRSLDISLDEASRQADTTLESILTPIHRGFEESGMSQEEACRLLEDELGELRRERRAERAS
jgi:hypothetical protein